MKKHTLTLLLVSTFCYSFLAVGQPTPTIGSSAANTLPHLHTRGGILYDEYGRQVVLHGVNEVNKQPPLIAAPDTNGFNEAHVKFIADHGFSVVRFGVFWAAIEPHKQAYDFRYLLNVKQMVELLAKYRIYVLIDFHQDAFASKHGGLGAPDWAALSDIPWTPEMNVGFPLNDFGGAVVNGQTVSPVLDQDNDAFWSNQDNIQDAYIEMVATVVRYLRGTPGILGYDLMNEPSPGSSWTEAGYIDHTGAFDFSKGCPTFDANMLTSFYTKLIQAVQKADREAIAWYEPLGLLGLGSPTFIGQLGRENIGFDFHNYMSWDINFAFQQAAKQQTLNQAALLMSEFGAGTLDATQMKDMLGIADQLNLSWIEWAYSNNPIYKFSAWPGGLPTDPTKQGIVYDLKAFVSEQCSTNKRCTAVNWPLLSALERPYPRYIAGTVEGGGYSYDPVSRIVLLSFSKNSAHAAASESAITEIYLPIATYPQGYTLELEGVTRLPESTPTRLLLKNNASGDRVSVRITPKNALF